MEVFGSAPSVGTIERQTSYVSMKIGLEEASWVTAFQLTKTVVVPVRLAVTPVGAAGAVGVEAFPWIALGWLAETWLQRSAALRQ